MIPAAGPALRRGPLRRTFDPSASMFPHTWRHHWALDEDPFVQEDADKDTVLARLPIEAVHSSFDRLYGTPDSPAPGIVFGEKGSGKSSLRLAMKRRLASESAFVVEYI